MKVKTPIEYILADLQNPDSMNNKILRSQAQPLAFPLQKEDKKHIKVLQEKFDLDEKLQGLAATQFGIPKRIIIFENPERAKYSDTSKGIVWLNPTYEKVNDKQMTETEVCYNVRGVVGPVKRYRRVYYKAFTKKGKIIKGEAKGDLARVIQHEIDHLNGKLFVDSVIEGKLTSLREWLFAHSRLGENDNDDDLYVRWQSFV